jgi:AI-2 transport protein TqsA
MNKPQGTESPSNHSVRDSLLIMATLIIIIAGARLSANLLVPFLLALFIAVICGSPINALSRRGLPGWLASSLVGLAVAVGMFVMFALLGNTADDFIDALPGYQKQFQALLGSWTEWFADRGIDISRDGLSGALDPAATIGFFGGFLNGLGGTLSNIVLILFTVMFLLADAPSFPRKLAMSETDRSESSLRALQELASSMNGYIATKTLVSLLNGFLIWIALFFMDVQFAVLWGFLAFSLNFVPNIGSVLAAIPPVLLSLLDGDPVRTGMIIGLYLVVNTVVGNVIEPRVMGQRVGLSTLAVFLSLVFWGWMFGAVGMLLSVPLTMVVKFITQQHPATAWFALLISNLPEDQPQAEPGSNQ